MKNDNENIGKELLIKFDRDLQYICPKKRNGEEDQKFFSYEIPRILACQYWGREKIGDIWYDKYVPKYQTKPINIMKIIGWENWEREADNIIMQMFRGHAEDGRKIEYSRSLKIEDVNQLLGVIVDYENGKVHKEDKILYTSPELGKMKDISETKVNRLGKHATLLVKDTAYEYHMDTLEEKRIRDMVYYGEEYLLGSTCVSTKFHVYLKVFCIVDNAVKTYYLSDSSCGGDRFSIGIRPVLLLRS